MKFSAVAALLRFLLLVLWSASVFGHGLVERVAEKTSDHARLFVADATNGDLVALDLPNGAVVDRITTPGFIMSLALSSDEQHLFVMRGRGSDRDWVTVVDTGLDPESGVLRPPYVARTIPVDTPGPGDESRMLTVAGKDALLMEGSAEFIVMQDTDFTGFAPIPVRKYKLGAPDHYFYLEAGENLYIGHLMQGYIQVLNRDSGEEVARIENCPLIHGKAHDKETGRLFYCCMRNIVVVGSRGDETAKEIARIPYPEKQRAAAFLHGKGRILWGYTEGILPIIYRLDTSVEPYELTTVQLGASIRQWATEGGEYLLSLTRGGVLQIRDGDSGEVLRVAEVAKPFVGEYHEHTDKAILPDIKSMDGMAYVSLPHEGRVAAVDLATAEIEAYFDVGGEPTRIVVIQARADAERAASNR